MTRAPAQRTYAPQPTAQPIYAPQPTAQPIYAPQPTAQPIYAPQPTAQPIDTPRTRFNPQADSSATLVHSASPPPSVTIDMQSAAFNPEELDLTGIEGIMIFVAAAGLVGIIVVGILLYAVSKPGIGFPSVGSANSPNTTSADRFGISGTEQTGAPASINGQSGTSAVPPVWGASLDFSPMN